MKKKDEGEERNTREILLLEKKKILRNLVLLLAASFVVLLGVLTMAWFAINKKTNGTSMSVITEAPKGVQFSLGKRTGTLLVANNNAIVDPTATLNDNDWMDTADIGAYYRFGRLIPASSISGKDIFYTLDSSDSGRKLKSGALVNKANGVSGLNATAHVILFTDGNDQFWDDYTPCYSWQNVNDDGYYVDISIWFRTVSSNAPISLKVEGCVGPKEGNIIADGSSNDEALYKAVRVALLRVTIEDNEEVLSPAAGVKKS